LTRAQLSSIRRRMRNTERMRAAFYEVMRHTSTMRAFRKAVSEPFGIQKASPTSDNLWRIMILDMQSRAHAKLPPHKVQQLHYRFLHEVGPAAAKNWQGQEKFHGLYDALVTLPYIGAKIASVFLRQTVCEYRIFPELKPYLFLPVDTHIETMLVRKLDVLDEQEISKENPLTSRKACRFQESLSQLPWLMGRWRRVDLDAFWYVGYLFCSKNSKTVCNDICWIRRYCQQRNE
jgi:hypothetical protein